MVVWTKNTLGAVYSRDGDNREDALRFTNWALTLPGESFCINEMTNFSKRIVHFYGLEQESKDQNRR